MEQQAGVCVVLCHSDIFCLSFQLATPKLVLCGCECLTLAVSLCRTCMRMCRQSSKRKSRWAGQEQLGGAGEEWTGQGRSSWAGQGRSGRGKAGAVGRGRGGVDGAGEEWTGQGRSGRGRGGVGGAGEEWAGCWRSRLLRHGKWCPVSPLSPFSTPNRLMQPGRWTKGRASQCVLCTTTRQVCPHQVQHVSTR